MQEAPLLTAPVDKEMLGIWGTCQIIPTESCPHEPA